MPRARYRFGAVFAFILLHAGLLLVWWTPPPMISLPTWFAATYSIRMFGVTAGYHRYFGHSSYKMGRAARFAMALPAQSSAQKGLWWASHHRLHHRGVGSGCPLARKLPSGRALVGVGHHFLRSQNSELGRST